MDTESDLSDDSSTLESTLSCSSNVHIEEAAMASAMVSAGTAGGCCCCFSPAPAYHTDPI